MVVLRITHLPSSEPFDYIFPNGESAAAGAEFLIRYGATAFVELYGRRAVDEYDPADFTEEG